MIILNSLPASTCKLGVLKMAPAFLFRKLQFGEDPSIKIGLLKISTNFQKQSFGITV